MTQYKMSVFRGFNKVVGQVTLTQLIQEVRKPKKPEHFLTIMQLYQTGKKEEADVLKKSTLAVTPSGVFEGGRKTENLKEYSKLLVLDIDKVETSELLNVMMKTYNDPYVLAAFRSISGTGFKLFVEVDSDESRHEEAYQQVVRYFEMTHGIVIDKSGKDVTRLCFLSNDPSAILKGDYHASVFHVEGTNSIPESADVVGLSAIPMIISENHDDGSSKELFRRALSITSVKHEYAEGERNSFIHYLANNCNRFGVPYNDAETLIRGFAIDLPAKEIVSTVKSAYKHTEEFARFADVEPLQNENSNSSVDTLRSTPTIPEAVYDNLPPFLKKACSLFSAGRERDVFLTGLLTLLSGCFDTITGKYDRKTNHMNLFALIVAPPASGKGTLLSAKAIIKSYHDLLMAGGPDGQSEPRALFIPADSSSAAVIMQLAENAGSGIMIEPEADTLANTLKQDWGGYSTIMRQAFQGETISKSRKQDKEFIEIEKPKMSIVLTGTPGQVAGVIASPEDGLFSRNLFYAYSVERFFRDPFPEEESDFEEEINNLAGTAVEQIVRHNEKAINFTLTGSQKKLIQPHFQQHLVRITAIEGDEAAASVMRLGLIAFRTAMLLTTVRSFESASIPDVLVCSDEDLQSALLLVDTYIEHAMVIFRRLPGAKGIPNNGSSNSKALFYTILPKSFSRSEAIKLGASLKLSNRTLDDYLKLFVAEKQLIVEKKGAYKKA